MQIQQLTVIPPLLPPPKMGISKFLDAEKLCSGNLITVTRGRNIITGMQANFIDLQVTKLQTMVLK